MLNGKKVIGVICVGINKEPSKPLVDNLAALLHHDEKHCMLVFQCFEGDITDPSDSACCQTVFGMINYDMIDVMVMLPQSLPWGRLTDDLANECRAHGVPLITVDIPLDGAYCVSFDYMSAFGTLIEHILTDHGCKRIKLVAGYKGNSFSEVRIEACREAMQKHGLEFDDNDIMYGNFWETPTYEAMDKLFESGEPLPEAFICCNDSMAMAVCLKLNERGIRVPEDVLVTGFDGIQMEKFHKPRLSTAVRDNRGLAEKILAMAEKILNGEVTEPYQDSLDYIPVFSESCGCMPNNGSSNRALTEYVRGFAYALTYEEHVNGMENHIAADPSPENVRKVLSEYSFRNSSICLTDEFCRCYENVEELPDKFGGYHDMHLFVSTYKNGEELSGKVFPAGKIMPSIEDSFNKYNTLLVIPLIFTDTVLGYLVTDYVNDEHHNGRLYTFTNSLNRCLETMRVHGRLSGLNQRLEFMFTHDQLTQIYNRYGFYNGFKEAYSTITGKDRDVFIVSIDLNDMKFINDNFGHAAGDDALCVTAKALVGAAESCGGGVICSRFGGDEFVAAKVCEGDAAEQAKNYRAAFSEVLDELNAESGKPYKVQVSMGIYSATLDGVHSIDGLIELADRLMYSDKAKHKRHPRGIV